MIITNESTVAQLRKGAFIKGLILGCILLVLNIFSFYFITKMTTSFFVVIGAPFIFAIVLPLIVAISLIRDLRNSTGGYWIFKQAVTGIFIMFLTAYVIQSIGRDLIFAKLIEPNMVQKTGEAVINATTTMLQKTGTDQSIIDKKVADMQKEFAVQSEQSVVRIAESIVVSIILLFVLSLIFGAIFKKEPPTFAVDPEDEEIIT